MAYQHQWVDGNAVDLPVGKVVCIGRNYAAHAAELNNPVPKRPLLFMKPKTALVPMDQPLPLPSADRGPVHYETEMAILIGETLTNVDEAQAVKGIAGVGVALDLTLRELQSELKSKGHPWEIAKGFDGACPMSAFVKPEAVADLQQVQIRLTLNDELVQNGNSANMLTPVLALISYISRNFTLEPGDIVLTGTPEGVGVLPTDAKLKVELADVLSVSTQVKS